LNYVTLKIITINIANIILLLYLKIKVSLNYYIKFKINGLKNDNCLFSSIIMQIYLELILFIKFIIFIILFKYYVKLLFNYFYLVSCNSGSISFIKFYL
jgi:hypothetical protein